MEPPLALPLGPSLDQLLHQRWGDDWLIGLDSREFWHYLEQCAARLEVTSPTADPGAPPMLWLAEPDPLRCLGTLLAGLWQGHTVVLTNPQWGQREWQQVGAIAPVPPLDSPPWRLSLTQGSQPRERPEILVPTGGTSGTIKFARHTWTTLMASVQGFCTHFGQPVIHAYCVLPLYHVSGLMQALRVLASGGQLALQPYPALKQGYLLDLPSQGFLSLVPTQLQWLIDQGPPFLPWLKDFQAVLLGGAAPWPSLLAQARNQQIPLAPTYGMTETASQVATLLPQEFLAGNTSSGKPLPHAKIRVLNGQGQDQRPGQVGRIAVEATSLCQGYLMPTPPACPPLPPGQTDDLGYLDLAGYLHLVGRQSNMIITGGENVSPEEVEAALLETAWVQDVCVVGIPDPQWGQKICALVVLKPRVAQLDALPRCLAAQLTAYKRPKYWILLPRLPRSAQGKLNRHQALTLAQRILG
jgi:o-succinylbenzoate---CoA ligase